MKLLANTLKYQHMNMISYSVLKRLHYLKVEHVILLLNDVMNSKKAMVYLQKFIVRYVQLDKQLSLHVFITVKSAKFRPESNLSGMCS